MNTEATTAGGNRYPRCFMHLHKCGGTSVCAALGHALPPGSLSPKSLDRSIFCGGFDQFDRLDPLRRAQIALEDAEIDSMRGARVVAGHFCLGTLKRLTTPSMVATVIREPRAQLLSLYAWWRINVVELGASWHPYEAAEFARQSIDDFLAEPSIATMTDNPLCRVLLYDRGWIPPSEFIAEADAARIVAAAKEQLDSLGCVAVLEFGERMWTVLSDFFGVRLQPVRTNVTTPAEGDGLSAEPVQITSKTMDLITERTAADAILYEHSLRQWGLSAIETAGVRATAFAAQLRRLDDLIGAPGALAVPGI